MGGHFTQTAWLIKLHTLCPRGADSRNCWPKQNIEPWWNIWACLLAKEEKKNTPVVVVCSTLSYLAIAPQLIFYRNPTSQHPGSSIFSMLASTNTTDFLTWGLALFLYILFKCLVFFPNMANCMLYYHCCCRFIIPRLQFWNLTSS